MFHKAVELMFREGTTLDVAFQSGEVKRFDMSSLFVKYPSMGALSDRDLFLSGKLMGQFGIIWTDEIDIDIETIYENGLTVSKGDVPGSIEVGETLMKARASKAMSQKELAEKSGINQADISRIERGVSNPSIKTLKKLASAMDMTIKLDFVPSEF